MTSTPLMCREMKPSSPRRAEIGIVDKDLPLILRLRMGPVCLHRYYTGIILGPADCSLCYIARYIHVARAGKHVPI